jgi:hypothetical protein
MAPARAGSLTTINLLIVIPPPAVRRARAREVTAEHNVRLQVGDDRVPATTADGLSAPGLT